MTLKTEPYNLYDGISSKEFPKTEIFLLVDKLSLFNQTASSGLRGNVSPM